MYYGVMKSLLMKRFAKGMKKRITEDSDRDKCLNSLVTNYILNDTDHEWVGSRNYQERNREMLVTASYISVTYGYSLIGMKNYF